MNHTKVNCSSCNKDLHIKVAKGENAPDKITCKACSEKNMSGPSNKDMLCGEINTKNTIGKCMENVVVLGPTNVTMKLRDALKIATGARRVMRCEHRDKNFVVTGE